MPIRKDAKIELLKSVPLFSLCNNKQLAALASRADLIDVAADRELVREGATDRDFVVIVEGKAEVRRAGKKVNTLGAGDFFGEIAVIVGGPRTATVVTKEPSTLLVVGQQSFWSLLEQMPGLQTSVMKAMGDRLHQNSI